MSNNILGVTLRDPFSVIPALKNLRYGERLVYHVGFLGDDAHYPEPNTALIEIAKAALELSKAGEICITQRRLGPPMRKNGDIDWFAGIGAGFEYIATGRRPEKVSSSPVSLNMVV